MPVPIVTMKDNIGAGRKNTFTKVEQSLSSEDNIKINIEHEPVKEFHSFYGNYLINTLEHFYKNATDKAFYLPKICVRCLSTKNENTKNCSTSLQGYCHGLWS